MRYQIRNAKVQFGADTILNSVNFEIHDTEKIAIVGRNGCGKTTLLRLIAGDIEMSNLLLDEPTNHLDIAAVEWLENYLKSYENAVVIVSHDRMFLDRVIDVTYEIEYGDIKRYPGNYSAFVRLKEDQAGKRL